MIFKHSMSRWFNKKVKENYIHYIVENKKIIHILSKKLLYNISAFRYSKRFLNVINWLSFRSMLLKDHLQCLLLYLMTVSWKKSEEELNTLSEELVSLLSTKEFSVNDFKIILSKCKNIPFDIVTLFLSKQVKEYQSCLELLLDTFSRIPNKEITLFSWLEMTLIHLKKT